MDGFYLVEFVCDLLDRVPHTCGVERSLVGLIAGLTWSSFPARCAERIFAATTHAVPRVCLEFAIVEALSFTVLGQIGASTNILAFISHELALDAAVGLLSFVFLRFALLPLILVI